MEIPEVTGTRWRRVIRYTGDVKARWAVALLVVAGCGSSPPAPAKARAPRPAMTLTDEPEGADAGMVARGVVQSVLTRGDGVAYAIDLAACLPSGPAVCVSRRNFTGFGGLLAAGRDGFDEFVPFANEFEPHVPLAVGEDVEIRALGPIPGAERTPPKRRLENCVPPFGR